MYLAALLTALLLQQTLGFAPHLQLAHASLSKKSLTSTPSSLAMSMQPLYDDLCNTVKQKFNLVQTDFTASYDAQTWSNNDSSGTAEWLAESSPQYLTGVSTFTRVNKNDAVTAPIAESYTINVWMGPSYDVPHMLLCFGQTIDGNYFVQSDYVPRGATVLGNDPQYLERYYSNVEQSYRQAYSSGFPIPPSRDFYTRLLTNSPVATAVAGLDAGTAESLARQHLSRHIDEWVFNSPVVPARSRGAFNMRDDKLRQFYYRGQVAQQTRELGQDLGMTVAAVNTGPTAEAYVGGGS